MTTFSGDPRVSPESDESEVAPLPDSVFDLPEHTLNPEQYEAARHKTLEELKLPPQLTSRLKSDTEFTGRALIADHGRDTTIPSWQVLEQELSIIRPTVVNELKSRCASDIDVSNCDPGQNFLECYLLYRFQQLLLCKVALLQPQSAADRAACHRRFDNLIERKLVQLIALTCRIENLPPVKELSDTNSVSPVSIPGGTISTPPPPTPPPPPASVRNGGTPGGPLPFTGLAFSGGGIRSATFALGVLQSIAAHKRLTKFDYLSTVSGGGYLGSWLKAWIYRLNKANDPAPLSTVQEDLPQRPDATTINKLREYSNFLSPKLGAFSADTWTLVSLVCRNLILNWLMFIPLAMLVIAGPWLALLFGARLHTWAQVPSNEYYRWLFTAIGIVSFGNALYHTSKFISETQYFRGGGPKPRFRGITEKTFVLQCGIPLVLGAVFFSLAAPAVSLPTSSRFILIGLLAGAIALAAASQPKQRQRLLWAISGLVAGSIFGVCLIAIHEIFLYARGAWVNQAWIFEGLWLTVPLALLSATFAATIFIGITSHLILATNLLHEWWAKFGGWILIVSLAWIAGVALTILLPWVLLSEQSTIFDYTRKSIAASGGLIGVITAAIGFFDSSAPSSQKSPSIFQKLKSFLLPLGALLFAIAILTACCIALLFIMFPGVESEKLMNFDTAYLKQFSGFKDPLVLLLLATGTLIIILLLTTSLFNYSRFTLHTLYRERLVRAYLGASHLRRNPDRFTGFDPSDSLRLYELRGRVYNPQLVRPFHLLNMTLNLTSSNNLLLQQRQGESFTASMLHAGTSSLGYQNIQNYAGPPRFNARAGVPRTGMTLGAAMAASGAAASPNMGYNSSPFVAFLLTVFNIRLGVWLPNPGPAGKGHHLNSGPRFALQPAVADLLGMTDDTSRYVNLTDGGHFDNMGMYELIRRRVQVIVCVDGECDNVPKDAPSIHEGLSQSIRKCFIDFGVEIRSEGAPHDAPPWNDNLCPKGYWLARIYYPHNIKPPLAPPEPGYLLYIKPRLFGDLPVDLRNYHNANPDFPQQTTADQWFSESQFESYRKLGEYIADSIPQSVWNKIGLP